MNDFSIICRLLGSLFSRQPQDAVLTPVFDLMAQGKLQQFWPIEQDGLLTRLQTAAKDRAALSVDYNAMFGGADASVDIHRSDYQENATEQEVRDFLTQRGMPLGDQPADAFGQLLLAASWLEDQRPKTKFRRKSRCLMSIYCRGVGSSWAKSKRMQPRRFIARWLN